MDTCRNCGKPVLYERIRLRAHVTLLLNVCHACGYTEGVARRHDAFNWRRIGRNLRAAGLACCGAALAYLFVVVVLLGGPR